MKDKIVLTVAMAILDVGEDDRTWKNCIHDAKTAIIAYNNACPRLHPDMPAQELRLHMGELTENELLVARAAIRWANSVRDGE